MIYPSNRMETQAILQTTAKICAAARTTPKTRGRDAIRALVLTGESKAFTAATLYPGYDT